MSNDPPATGPRDQSRTRAVREYTTVLLVGVASAALAVLASTGDRQWGTATVDAEGLPARMVASTARAAAPEVGAAALVALAALGAVLATAGRWRQLIGCVVVTAGLVVAAGSLLAGPAVESTLRDEVAATAAGTDPAAADQALADLSGTAWRWLAAVGGAGITAAGAATVLRGTRWPAMGRRYQPPGVDRQPLDETDLWRVLDRGDDPTDAVDIPPGGHPGGPAAPDDRRGGAPPG